MTDTLGPIPRFSTIGLEELANIRNSLGYPLSGYLGGKLGKGYWCQRLEDEWCDAFKVKHAVVCNSATSGLLAACMAIGIKAGDEVWVPSYTMSATASCAKILGAKIKVIDIDTTRFSMYFNLQTTKVFPKAVIVTNLFGHPAYLQTIRTWCDINKVWMIEDAAQSPFAKEGDRYAGTIGHIGVFSFNIHKHIQCGEGGVIVTNKSSIQERLHGGINHGELGGHNPGLNLRMTEPIAAIACAQLKKARHIIPGRIELAEHLTDMVSDIPWIRPHEEDTYCRNVYYHWVATVSAQYRKPFVDFLNSRGFPMIEGYSPPLNRIFQTGDSCPVAERLEDYELIKFEVCSHDPTERQLRIMKDMVREAADSVLEAVS